MSCVPATWSPAPVSATKALLTLTATPSPLTTSETPSRFTVVLGAALIVSQLPEMVSPLPVNPNVE